MPLELAAKSPLMTSVLFVMLLKSVVPVPASTPVVASMPPLLIVTVPVPRAVVNTLFVAARLRLP